MTITLSDSSIAALRSEYPTLLTTKSAIEDWVNVLVLQSVVTNRYGRRLIEECQEVATD